MGTTTRTLQWNEIIPDDRAWVSYNTVTASKEDKLNAQVRHLEHMLRDLNHENDLLRTRNLKLMKGSRCGIKNVIFNGPCTIVFWDDNTKTVVHCENEEFDKEKGLAMAICKKHMGNTGRYFETFKKYTREEK